MTEQQGELEKAVDIWRDHQLLYEEDGYLLVTHSNLEDDEIIFVNHFNKMLRLNRVPTYPHPDNIYKYTARVAYDLQMSPAEAQRLIDGRYEPIHYKPADSTELIHGIIRIDVEEDMVQFLSVDPSYSETWRDAYAPNRQPLGEDD